MVLSAPAQDDGVRPTTVGSTIPSIDEPRSPSEFSGTWKYNAGESVDAASGRPETARAARRGAAGSSASAEFTPSASPLGATSASVVRDAAAKLYLASRDARRDLLEIAPTLQLQASGQAVAITDDLDRVLAFPADGSTHRYQIGAALFDARSYWDRGQLKIDIDGPDGLKISETWFLSEDGSRLFLIIRLGDPVKTTRPVGVNRVYDRVQRSPVPLPSD
jgi:hypothetical protein